MRKKTIFLRLTIAALVMLLSKEVSKAELIGYWNLDEYNDTKVSDSSGKGHDGALIGGLSFTTNSAEGIIGRAISLNGKDDYIYVDSIHIPVSAFTIALWFNPDSNLDSASKRMDLVFWGAPTRPLCDKPYLSFNKFKKGEISLIVTDGQGHLSQHEIRTTTTSWESSTWYHIAATFDGFDFKVYINGVLENMATHPMTHYASSSVYFGIRSDLAYPFEGKLDDIRIYGLALSTEEISQLYNVSSTLQRLMQAVQEAEAILKRKEFPEAIAFIIDKISEYKKCEAENPFGIELCGKGLSSELYFLLAQAKHAAGAPIEDVIADYKRAISEFGKGGAALVWLFRNTSAGRYYRIVKNFVQNDSHEYQNISRQFEKFGDWALFGLFLEVLFSETENPVRCAKSIGDGLSQNGVWKKRYLKYCKNKPQLTEYVFRKDCELAEQYIAKDDFEKAAEIYMNILNRCSPDQDRVSLEFKFCNCIFNAGRYQDAITELDRFIQKYKVVNHNFGRRASLMKGQSYMRLGEIDKALNEFLALRTEYPESEQSPDVNFLIGYCYMLEERFKEAEETFNDLVQMYPESLFSNKARICLTRVDKMVD